MDGRDENGNSGGLLDYSVAQSSVAAEAGWRKSLSSSPARPHYGSAKEKLHAYLIAHPPGADSRELLGLLFSGAGSDPELGGRIIAGILDGDPNFAFDSSTGLWSLSSTIGLRVSLDQAEFVVVDLETASGRPAPGSIIEIGAYRMRGRHIMDSFESLVRPRMRIPRFVARLTSIGDEMVAVAPPIEEVLPRFRAFMGEAVMVAHNAQFDRAFLDFEFRRLFGIGLLNPVLCTLRMARRLLPSIKRRRLDLLAEHFGLSTAGRHRGLGDARMAAELLSIFLEIAEQMGLNRLDRLLDHHSRGVAGRRIERHVAPEVIAAMPQMPGVYLMRNRRGDLLYVGKAARLKERVGSYFNGEAHLNAKTAELVSHIWAIETRVARSSLEAALLEARLIRELKPPYNRMLKSAAPAWFIRVDLTDPFPRLQAVQKLTARVGVLQIGPFIGRRNIEHSLRALSRILGLRTCGGRLEPREDFSPCIYGQMGHCAAPCNLSVSEDRYNEQARRALTFLRGRSGLILGELARARDQAAAAMHFEEAKRHHRSLEALATLAERRARLSRVVTENNVVIVVGAARGDGAAPAAVALAGAEVDAVTMTDAAASTDGAAAGRVAAEQAGAKEDRLKPVLLGCPAVYVVLSGRLTLVRDLDSPQAANEVAQFIAHNYERYKLRPVLRSELEAMSIVVRWLKERAPDDGNVIPLTGPGFDTNLLEIRRAG
jgi:DNA polymerase-3 subunit epsilon